jgi:hypothetical protein
MKHADKYYHFFAGIIIYILFYIFLNSWLSIVPVIIIGAAKEAYDYYSGKGNPEWLDFIATVAGGLFVLLITL